MRYRWQGVIVFFAITVIVSNFLENLSIVTGFPFGHYQYSDVLGLKVFYVPVLIGPAYIAVGYLAWVLAAIIVPHSKNWGIPILAAVLMVSWDLTFDPTSSTINHWWVWKNGGTYFGVPLSNFAGWAVTTVIIYVLYAIYLSFNQRAMTFHANEDDVQPIVMYATIAAGSFIAILVTKDTVVFDAAGQSWHTVQITIAEAVAAALTMFPGAILAAIRLQGASATVTQPVHHLSDIDPQLN